MGVRPFRTVVRLEKEVMRVTTEQGSVKTLQVYTDLIISSLPENCLFLVLYFSTLI